MMACDQWIWKLPLQGEKKETDMVGRACMLEVDEVKLIIVYIYWGLKKHYASREDISLIKTQKV